MCCSCSRKGCLIIDELSPESRLSAGGGTVSDSDSVASFSDEDNRLSLPDSPAGSERICSKSEQARNNMIEDLDIIATIKTI